MEAISSEERPTPIAPPTLHGDWKLENPPFVELREERAWKRILIGGASFACAATALACKVINFQKWNATPVGGTVLSLVIGAGVQNTTHYVLNHQWSNAWKSFLGDYSLVAFMTLSQVYNNLNHPATSLWRVPIFSALTGMGGMCAAAFVHTLVARRLSDSEEISALPVEEHRNPIFLPLAGLNRRASRVAWNVTKLVIGFGGVFLGVYYPPALIVRDYSIMLVGDATAQLGHEFWVKQLEPRQDQTAPTNLKKADTYFQFMKVFLVASHVLPGILIATAGGIQKSALSANWIYGLASIAYFFTGFTAGGKRHLEIIRFSNVPYQELRELRRKHEPRNVAEKIFGVGKWIFAIGGVGGFLGLGLAGFSFQTMRLEPVSFFDRMALVAVAVGLYGSYAVAKFAKRFFDPENHNFPLRNTAYFLTHYSPSIPWLALYLIEKMDIGDKALDQSTILTGVLASLAYFSLGNGIGLEAALQGEYPHPRVYSSISAALINKFIFQQMTNQI